MKTIKLDMTHIQTVKALHIYLAYMLDLPGYYGRNLDALHDLLGSESEALCIVLTGKAASEEMAAYLPRLEKAIADSAKENARLRFEKA